MSGCTRWITKHGSLAVFVTAIVGTSTAAWLHGVRDGAPFDRARPPDDVRVEIPTEGLPHKGAAPDRARVTMIVCSDFECPFSKRASGTVTELLAKNDDLAFFHAHFPLGAFEHSTIKAMAAAAAQRQDQFWRMHDALFDAEVDSQRSATELARELGLDADRFAADLRDPALYVEVARQRQLCRNAGVRAVPTFFINGRRFIGSQPTDAFQRVIDQERR